MTKAKIIKIVAIIACVGAIIAGSVAATVAYLAMKTNPVDRTFTAGNISIALNETDFQDEADIKMIPGVSFSKDPKVTVFGGSEACWLFVKIDKTTNFDTYLTYATTGEWTALDGFDGVYYREVAASADDQEFQVLAGNKITAKAEVGKDKYDLLNADNWPTITITAYAVQSSGVNTASAAWTIAKDLQ